MPARLCRTVLPASLLVALLLSVSCGGGPAQLPSPSPASSKILSLTVSPTSVAIEAGGSVQIFAFVEGSGSFDPSVVWYVNDVKGGSSTLGTISSAGLYAAPAAVPNPSGVAVKAVSVQNPTKFATSAVTINPPRAASGNIRSFIFTGYDDFAAVSLDGDGNIYASTVPVARVAELETTNVSQPVVLISLNPDLSDRWQFPSPPPIWSIGQALGLSRDQSRLRLAGMNADYTSLHFLEFNPLTGGLLTDRSCSIASQLTSGLVMRFFEDRLYAAVQGPGGLSATRIIITSDLSGPLDCSQQLPVTTQGSIDGLWVTSDHVLVTGPSYCLDGTDNCSYLWTFDHGGNQLWSKVFPNVRQLHVVGTTENSEAVIYVAGRNQEGSMPTSSFVQKLDEDGNEMWANPVIATAGEGACGSGWNHFVLGDLIPSPSGGVTLVGSIGSLDDCTAGDVAALLIAPDGSTESLLRGDFGGSEGAATATYDPTGKELILVGSRSTGQFSPIEDIVVIFELP
jgi:hypothetical protein